MRLAQGGSLCPYASAAEGGAVQGLRRPKLRIKNTLFGSELDSVDDTPPFLQEEVNSAQPHDVFVKAQFGTKLLKSRPMNHECEMPSLGRCSFSRLNMDGSGWGNNNSSFCSMI